MCRPATVFCQFWCFNLQLQLRAAVCGRVSTIFWIMKCRLCCDLSVTYPDKRFCPMPDTAGTSGYAGARPHDPASASFLKFPRLSFPPSKCERPIHTTSHQKAGWPPQVCGKQVERGRICDKRCSTGAGLGRGYPGSVPGGREGGGEDQTPPPSSPLPPRPSPARGPAGSAPPERAAAPPVASGRRLGAGAPFATGPPLPSHEHPFQIVLLTPYLEEIPQTSLNGEFVLSTNAKPSFHGLLQMGGGITSY